MPDDAEQVAINKLLEAAETARRGLTDNQFNRLATFLYILMRDNIPTGVVPNVVQELDKIHQYEEAVFSNEHLLALARDYAHRILNENA